ncbi:MAG TPA: hypothetical protein VN948_21500 [Terriglobales bacterium]|nr:hypothetical protein [Terriglobales bacterium]
MTAANLQNDKVIEKRSKARLNAKLDKNLLAYAAAASAAGLSVLAPSAEAKIVYTPAHIPVSSRIGTKVGIDINNDGIRDFFFLLQVYHGAGLQVFPANVEPSNAIWGTNKSASALPAGYTVGKNAKFQKSHNGMAGLSCVSGFCKSSGLWQDAQNMYLGLAITIHGKVHYGWARLNVSSKTLTSSTLITGYAYETLPNTPIVTGKTESAEDARVPIAPTAPDALATAVPTLGLLAQGSGGLSAWRKERN